VKWLLAHTCVNGYYLRQIDFITAFLNSLIENKFLYVEQVESFEQGDPNEWIYLLLKALYGLKTALALWQKTLHKYMHRMGFVPSPANPCLFTMDTATIAIWVDDMLAYNPDEKKLNRVYKILSKQFKTKDLGTPAHFLSMEITRDFERNEITLSQHTYLAKIIERFDRSNVKNREVPMNPSITLTKYESQATKQAVRNYASEIGNIN
jgi:Reverse transcriptase (RNA-dependent DNA polymerase)